MSVNVVVGAQYGGEGKGKIVSHLCRTRDVDLVIRCGGPNSGHTVFVDQERTILQQIPAGAVVGGTNLALAAGCLIDHSILKSELKRFGLDARRVTIDPNATIVKPEYRDREKDSKLRSRIASTCSGTGVAVAERALRKEDVVKASDVPELEPYLGSVQEMAIDFDNSDRRVIIEGTQGFGLSVHHGPHYPYVTSRDTTASAFLSEVGLPPTTVSEITMVVRTFPIRVGGNSGPLPKETDWETISEESGYPSVVREFTTVSNTERRVAEFDVDVVQSATTANRPTQVAVHGLDYLDYENFRASSAESLTRSAWEFITEVEGVVGAPVQWVGTGPRDRDLLEIRSE